MSALVSMVGAGGFSMTPAQVKLVKTTVAKDCNDQEFNLFLEVARGMGLNPFTKQIMPMVFGKKSKDENKRRMSIIVTRDGQRVIASRCGNYRPASDPATILTDESLKSPNNPKGIVSATVKLWQQDNAGTWWPVVGEAYWDEFAPLSYPPSAYDYIDTGEVWEDSGRPTMEKRLKEGAVLVLDQTGNWGKMPIVMITKCAEMAALRAGWPEQFSGVYAEEELHKAQAIDLSASEILEREEAVRRQEAISKEPSILVCFNGETAELDAVPVGQFADRVLSWIKGCDRDTTAAFMERNRMPLREFWAKSPSDALELKRHLEAKIGGAK